MTDDEKLNYIIADQTNLMKERKSAGKDTTYTEDVIRFLKEYKKLKELVADLSIENHNEPNRRLAKVRKGTAR